MRWVMKGVIMGAFLVSGLGMSTDTKALGQGSAGAPGGLWDRPTLTNGFGGMSNALADRGVEAVLGVTDVFQQSLTSDPGGRRHGRNTGSYDLEFTLDLDKVLGLKAGTFYTHVEGNWGRLTLDDVAVGSSFGTNTDSVGVRTAVVTEAWYEQSLFNKTLQFRVGKLDIRGGFECRGCPESFDGSAFANDETGQFLNGSLVNNPTIPFPDMGLGLVVHWNPIEWWYAGAGVMDGDADAGEIGFNTTFDGDDHFFYVFETGVTPRLESGHGPLQGAYRVGVWHDRVPKAHSDAAGLYTGDTGFYISCDQRIWKETAEPEDAQGLGAFLRYGYADEERNDLVALWSMGVQYQGPIAGRDSDVAAVGFAQGSFSDLAEATYTADQETVVEAYYNAQVAPWLNLTPGVQWIDHPGGNRTPDHAWVAEIRAQIAF